MTLNEIIVFGKIDIFDLVFSHSQLRLCLDTDPAVSSRELIAEVSLVIRLKLAVQHGIHRSFRKLLQRPVFPVGKFPFRDQEGRCRSAEDQGEKETGEDLILPVFLFSFQRQIFFSPEPFLSFHCTLLSETEIQEGIVGGIHKVGHGQKQNSEIKNHPRSCHHSSVFSKAFSIFSKNFGSLVEPRIRITSRIP